MTYHLFISHSLNHQIQYDKLKNLLDNKSHFSYKDYSVSQEDPIYTNGTEKQLKEKIKEQMKHCRVILILAGVNATYRKWTTIEIEIAKELEKRIIAIEPWGSEKTSQLVKDNADRIVKWNTKSIVDAIRERA